MSDQTSAGGRGEKIRNGIGIGILAAAFLWAAIHVLVTVWGPDSGSRVGQSQRIVRFAHWQLEGGIVDALNDACRMYEELHPDVRVEQIPVPERAYDQWTRTQLIGRTAPDLIQLGRAPQNIVVRYFVPLSAVIETPNPYNSRSWAPRVRQVLEDQVAVDMQKKRWGDASVEDILGRPDVPPQPDLEKVPWRDTYIDGMQGGYDQGLQDQYGMPLSIFTMRCYANKDILLAATGKADPPKDLESFFHLCKDIQRYAQENHLRLVPIAGSKYTEGVFWSKYWGMAVWDLLEKMDLNEDSGISIGELILGSTNGTLNWETDPNVRAGHEVLYEISRYFNPGFVGADRDQSVFLFAQGNAAMIATGTWDAGSLYKQVGGAFDIVVFDFPLPRPDNPKYGPYIRTRLGEADKALFPFGLTKFSADPDLAIDFMHFLTSQKMNEYLNRRFRWFPAIRGAGADKVLEAFAPKLDGVYEIFKPYVKSAQTGMLYDQIYHEYLSTATTAPDPYDQFIHRYAEAFRREIRGDFQRSWKNDYSGVVQTEGALAQVRNRAMRTGMTVGTQHNLSSLAIGQVRRIQGRATDAYLVQKAGQLDEERRKREGGP